MTSIDRNKTTALYCQVIDLIVNNIDAGSLSAGDKLPSLRHLSQRLNVSVPTVRQAYIELERQRRVVARPKSGYYVRAVAANDIVRPATTFRRNTRPTPVRSGRLIDRVFEGINRPELVPLGIANPSKALPATRALNRCMKRIMARSDLQSPGYAHQLGELALRRQISFRYLDQTGCDVPPGTICITNGGQEALLLALCSVADKGDVIAVEAPTYHGVLELIHRLGMLAIEVETCPEEGVTMSALRKTLQTHPVKACVFSTTLSNPLGVSMPEQYRKELIDILDQHDTVLIEDDVYGELLFDGSRPTPAQFLSDSDRIITCGSFSKTVAPSYRIGWALGGRFVDDIARLKRAFSVSSGLLPQLTLGEFLANGDYDRHLRQLRAALQLNCDRTGALVARHFPAKTRTSKPVGGSVLWLELPRHVDSEALFEHAIDAGISIAPGLIFSPCNRFRHFIRLSFGHPWSDEIERSIRWLGEAV